MKLSMAFAMLVSLGLLSSADGYELAAHGAMTAHAWTRVTKDNPNLVATLGLVDGAAPLGSSFYEMNGSTVTLQSKGILEDTVIGKLGGNPLSISGWLMRGAIREDDVSLVYGLRVLNHFYDPVNDKPLTLAGVAAGKKAPDWAIGSTDAFASPNTPNTARTNHYTVFDAREALYRAVTGMAKDGTSVAATEDIRKAYWATTFRALGDLVHLIQDMAQPQHTRNDPHQDITKSYTSDLGPLGHASFYEKYTDMRAGGSRFFTPLQNSIKYAGLDYDSYSVVPQFNGYYAYFSSRPARGMGMADYSNRGFFSAGTNIDTTLYAEPSPGAAYLRKSRSANATGATIDTLQGSVPDSVQNKSDTDKALSSYGIWDQFLEARQKKKKYTLTKYNYDDMADLLIPRAVAYSAGLINYFFRGRLQISLPAEGVYSVVDHRVENAKDVSGFRKIKLKLKNITSDIVVPGASSGIPQALSGGKLVVVARYHRNDCYLGDTLGGEYAAPGNDWRSCRTATEEIVVSDPQPQPFTLNAGEEKLLWFNFPTPIPINATDVYLQVVYRGALGAEDDAVVVASKDISEPTFYELVNFSDCLLNNDGTSTVNAQASPYSWQTTFSRGAPTIYVASVTNLMPGTFSRLALLTDSGYFPAVNTGYSRIFSVLAVVNQVDATGRGTVTQYSTMRAANGMSKPYIYSTEGYGYWAILSPGSPFFTETNGRAASRCFAIGSTAFKPLTINFLAN